MACMQSVVEFRKVKDQFEVVPSPDLLYRMGFLPRPGIVRDIAGLTSIREGASDEEERKDFDGMQKSSGIDKTERKYDEIEKNQCNFQHAD